MPLSREYIIYTDESSSDGLLFSNFYGGVLCRSADLERVTATLDAKRSELNLLGEIKWTKVSAAYRDRYIEFADCFMDLVSQDVLKVRIMFTQNLYRATGLTKEHQMNRYWILYYEFLKHAFGLQYSNPASDPIRLRLLIDQMPGTVEQKRTFKNYITRLSAQPEFRRAGIHFANEQIGEVRSHDHVILQGLDIILGSMHFRLNKLHLAKPKGQPRRGNRTLAKDAVYRSINTRLQQIRPHFNVGITTGTDGDPRNRWCQPYRHWRFLARQHEREKGQK